MNGVTFRVVTPDDAEELLAIYAPYVASTAVSFECTVPTGDEFRRRIKAISAEYPYIAAMSDGRIVGYAYASSFHAREAYRHTCEISIYVAADCHGKGIGRRLYSELEKLLVSQNVFVCYACVTTTDWEDDPYLTDASVRFHEKVGYSVIGRHENCGYKFGRWYGIVWMEKVLSERPSSPAPFIPFPHVAENENKCDLFSQNP